MMFFDRFMFFFLCFDEEGKGIFFFQSTRRPSFFWTQYIFEWIYISHTNLSDQNLDGPDVLIKKNVFLFVSCSLKSCTHIERKRKERRELEAERKRERESQNILRHFVEHTGMFIFFFFSFVCYGLVSEIVIHSDDT